MALDKDSLKANIIQIMTDMMEREENSIEEFAERLSTAVDTYVKTATIVYTTGLTAPNGAVTGSFQGNLE
ncbi:hypothetical protein [Formosa sp. S-31]|uniref:hypothetical protein n=1 Tax=Formosa sp. S-31 TaxID=2790949 RepID=UPI003EC09186